MKLLSKIAKAGVYQHDSSDCGVACLATAINFLGGQSSIEAIRKNSGTDQSGTTLLGLYQAAIKCNLCAEGYEGNMQEIKKFKDLLILHVTLESGYEHYLLSFGFDGKKFITWDPSVGLKHLEESEIAKLWISRKCLGLKAGVDFKHSKTSDDIVFNWLKEKINHDLNILIVGFILGLIMAVLGLVMAFFTQRLVDDILPSKNFSTLTLAVILLFILLTAKIVLGYLRQILLLEQGRAFNIRIIDEFFSHLLDLPKTFFDTRRKGDMIGRLNDTMRIQRVISEFVGSYMIDLILVFVTIIFMFFYSWRITLITILFMPFYFLIVYKSKDKISTAQKEVMAGYANTESNYIDTLGGIIEIKSMQWKPLLHHKNNTIFNDFQNKIFDLGRIKTELGTATAILSVFYLSAMLFIGTIEVFRQRLTNGEFLAIISLGSGILPSVLNLAIAMIPFSEIKVAVSRMFEFTQTEPEEQKGFNNTSISTFHSISIKNLTFRFPGRNLLIRDASLEIKKGELITIMGESGGGKTTLSGLILRFYDPESGDILINDHINSDSVALELWRSKIVLVPQEIHVFNTTILGNLLMDLTVKKIEELVRMLEDYELSDFINSFPSGMFTIIGEEGLSLSGGQKQMLGFIRAIFMKPDFLIMDEGTSNLDHELESLVLRSINKLRDKMGIIIISHKSNLLKCISDRIYVLGNGRLDLLQPVNIS